VAALASGAASVADITGNAVAAGRQGGSVLRFMGRLQIFQTSQNQTVDLALGVTLVSADALAAGAVPDPQTDLQQSWYYWTRIRAQMAIDDNNISLSREFDIRTSRRIRSDQRLILVFEAGALAGTIGVSVSARLLWRTA